MNKMNKLQDDLYQRLHGFKSVKRTHKKQGQSDWYYLDPRGARTVAGMNEINVAGENAPNPQLDSILSDNMRQNPEDYYIWRTRKDDKVRSKHAEREGKIFNKHIPPEGGNPGEEYNCRCWAEPYKPEKSTNKPIKVDMSGLDMFKLNSSIDTDTQIQYAQNDKAETQSDTNQIDYSLYGEGFSKKFIDEMENDIEFQKILNEYIIPNEGGYNNDPEDTGGETNMGIAKHAHQNENIKKMTRQRANAIYYEEYYKWNGLYKLPYQIRGFVVDYGLPTNPLIAIQTVHKVLGLPPNGNIIGQNTLNIFKNFSQQDYEKFLETFKIEMKKHFTEVARREPQKEKFLKGWLKRANRAHLAQ